MAIIKQLIISTLIITFTYQQPQNNFDGTVNFQGNFDSMHPGNTPPIEQSDDEQPEQYLQEQQDMLQFSEYMADFLPDETFTFKLSNNQIEQLLIWPSVDVQLIRGMFHSQILEQDSESYVSLTLYDNDQIVRNYKQQRLGVFNIPHTLKDHKYMFRFVNGQANSQVYFSYQIVTKQKRQNKNQKNESQIESITKQFEKVNKLIVQQESQMSRLMNLSQRHQERVDKFLSSIQWNILFQTLVICFGNICSLILLKRLLYSGYQLLV